MTLIGLSYIAGILTLLNPCTFPLIPILLSSTWQRNQFGPIILIFGLSFTFIIMGFALATSQMVLGMEIKKLRLVSVLLLLIIGIFLVHKPLQSFLRQSVNTVSMILRQRFSPLFVKRLPYEKMVINLLIGVLLGFIWFPCTGPTLSLALSLASRGDYFGQATLLMTLYSLGITTPLIGLSYASKRYLLKREFLKHGQSGRKWIGISLIVISILILTGCDKAVETWAISHSPQWLLKLTTKY